MLLTPYGWREWLAVSVLALIFIGVSLVAGWWIVAIAIGVLWMAVLSFFRDPPRRIDTDLGPGVMLSPADGKISAVLTVDEHPATTGPAVIVRIFLSVLNVHVNRAPCDAVVIGTVHTPGQFLNAQRDDSADLNEANLILLARPDGERMGVRQVAGMIARRIVCPLEPGDRLERGQKFGMIKFGSTTELILPRPDDVTVHVAVGDRVQGGMTKLVTVR